MQRIACYSTVFTISIVGLVGCSSGWTFDNWRNALTFNRPPSQSTQSVSELQRRARQLEAVGEYDAAADVYAQILKQDHDHRFAQQRLTEFQRLKRGLSDEKPSAVRMRERSPASRETELRQSQRQPLPAINPGPTGTARSIARQERSINRSAAAQHSGPAEPVRGTASLPEWARPAENRDPGVEERKKRVPLDQFMARAAESTPARTDARREVLASGPVNLPAVYDAQTIREARNSSSPRGVAQVSMTATLPEIASPAPSSTESEELTLVDVQKRLTTHPADPSAIETLIQGIRTEDRIGRWEISSTLGVLIQNPDSKSLIIDSLSRALTDQETGMRRNTALVIASLGGNAQELLPALEKRLNDREEPVRAAAAYAIDEIR